MGLFDKMKQYVKEAGGQSAEYNALFTNIKKKLIADGKEHIIVKEILVMSQKTIAGFEETMNKNGFELIDLDINPSGLGKGWQSVKVKYRSKE